MKTADLLVAWLAVAVAVAFILICAITAVMIVWDSYRTSKRIRERQREADRRRDL